VGRPDYALLRDGAPLMFIGAKALGKPEDLDKLITYCNARGVPYFVATDGVHWELYEVFRPVPTAQKKIVEFDLMSMDLGEVARTALALWRRARTVAAAPVSITASSQPVAMLPQTATASTAYSHGQGHVAGQAQVGTLLSSLHVRLGDPPPKRLTDPNGVDHPVKAWRDILILVVEWLLRQGLVKATDCPVKLPRASRYLISTSPNHQSGDSFSAPEKIEYVWVETKASSRQLTHDAVFFLRQYGKGGDFIVG
jgi:hypothetical protein